MKYELEYKSSANITLISEKVTLKIMTYNLENKGSEKVTLKMMKYDLENMTLKYDLEKNSDYVKYFNIDVIQTGIKDDTKS